MNITMITNEFLKTPKFTELTDCFLTSAKRLDVQLNVVSNSKWMNTLPTHDECDGILFWDKDIMLARRFEQAGFRCFNASESIRICDHKGLTYMELVKHTIPMPRTILAPFTYSGVGYTNMDFLDEVIETLGLPLVMKECYGSFGAQVYLIHSKEELCLLTRAHQDVPLLYQEFLAKHQGNDLRLQVVGNRVVAAMHRFSDKDFRANITNGGQMEMYEPTIEEKELAVECCNYLGLDFAGVDLLYDDSDRPVVCEVNSNAHFVNLMQCTGVQVSDEILSYIKLQLTDQK